MTKLKESSNDKTVFRDYTLTLSKVPFLADNINYYKKSNEWHPTITEEEVDNSITLYLNE
jgi:hypothetical protein